MAWYHVAQCDCPVGCCDCSDPKTERLYSPEIKPPRKKLGNRIPDECCSGCGRPCLEEICDDCATAVDEGFGHEIIGTYGDLD